MVLRFLVALGLLWLPGCVTPLTQTQRLSSTYVAKETGDILNFAPDGSYTYTIGGPATHAWSGHYQYSVNGELDFTYALSAHVDLWQSIQVSADKSRLTIVCGWSIGMSPEIQNATPYRIGRTLHFVEQRASVTRDR